MNINPHDIKQIDIIVTKAAIIVGMAIIAATLLNAVLAWIVLSS